MGKNINIYAIDVILKEYGFVKEYKFCTGRRWRFDYANIEKKVAIEIEGGIWVNGRHTRGFGYLNDIDKYNMAVLLGWRLLRFTYDHFNNDRINDTINIIEQLCTKERM